MASDQHDDPRNKFREAFKLIGEAAGEALREGITRIDRARRGSANVLTEPMRQAGARVLRSHGVNRLLLNPDGTPASDKRAELILRDIAAEVYDTMREAAHGEDKRHPDAAKAGPTPEPSRATPESTETVSPDQKGPDQKGPDQTGPDQAGTSGGQAEAVQRKNVDTAEETVPMPGQSF
jgi:hypothetical protein